MSEEEFYRFIQRMEREINGEEEEIEYVQEDDESQHGFINTYNVYSIMDISTFRNMSRLHFHREIDFDGNDCFCLVL